MESLPVIFRSQKNPWMDQDLFVDWYVNHFKPSVRQFHSEKGISGKTILLLEYRLGHKMPPNYLENDNFEIMYFPPNTSSILQPMDQGIFEKTQTRFSHRLMQLVLHHQDSFQSFCSNYSIKECLELLVEAWKAVTCNNIRSAWCITITSIFMPAIKEEQVEQLEIQEMQDMMSTISEENVQVEDIEKFLQYCHKTDRRQFMEVQAEKRRNEDDQNMAVNTNVEVYENEEDEMDANRSEQLGEYWDEKVNLTRTEEINENRNKEMEQNMVDQIDEYWEEKVDVSKIGDVNENRKKETEQNRDDRIDEYVPIDGNEHVEKYWEEKVNVNTSENMYKNGYKEMEGGRDVTGNKDECNEQNLNYQQRPQDHGIELNAQERIRLNSAFKELEAFVPRMPPSTRLHLEAFKMSIFGSKQ